MRQKYSDIISIVLEGLFPIIGFYFLGWSVLDILLFYSLDVLAFEYNFNLKLWYIIRKPKYFKGFDPQFRVQFLSNAFLSFLGLLLILASFYWALHIFQIQFLKEKSLQSIIINFFANNYFLLPLLFLARHMQTYMQFIKPHLYVDAQVIDLIKRHFSARGLLLLSIALLSFLPYIFPVAGYLIVLMVVGKLSFDSLTFLRRSR